MALKNMVITVSREHGSGGREIAQEVARQLKLPFVDSQIIRLATQQLNIPAEELAQFDEKVLPHLDELSKLVTNGSEHRELALSEVLAPSRNAYGLVEERQPKIVRVEIDPDEKRRAEIHRGYHELVAAMIKTVAAKGGAVILGRGGNFILSQRPNTVHIHVHAPLQYRLQRLVKLQKVSQAEAEQDIKEKDEQRARYIRRYHQADWRDPSYYTLTINTATLALPSAVATICQLAKSVAAQKAEQEIHSTYERLDQESYTLKEAAELLWTSPDILRQAIYRGELKAAQVDHRINRISRAALVEYLHRGPN
jgi:cytidylate kinase